MMNYLLWTNIYLVVFYGFYWAFLRNTTFFQIKRFYLLLASIGSFLLPFLTWSNPIVDEMSSTGNNAILAAVTISQQMNQIVLTNEVNSTWNTIAILYFIGLLSSFSWLIIRCIVTYKSLKTTDHTAFSFFKQIVIDPKTNGYHWILMHERTHANELHSIDVLFFEIVKGINWFNPICYLMTRSVKLNHEYIADQKSCTSADRIDYAQLLLSKTFSTDTSTLTNNFFNGSILKPRIAMLFKNRSKKTTLGSFIVLIPVLVLAIACQSTSEKTPSKKGTADTSSLGSVSTVMAPTDVESSSPSLTQPITDSSNQETTPQSNDETDKLFMVAEIMPEFEGGMKNFYQYIGDNYTYPDEAVENNVNGKLLLQFVVEKDGSLSNINILQDLKYGTGEEAVRVLKNSPKWKPGIQNGKPVRTQFTLPIQLNLSKVPGGNDMTADGQNAKG